MSDSLSILNDPPKRIEGPGLLHHLIQWDDHSARCAIDFTASKQRRQYTYQEVQCCVTALASRIHEALSTNRLDATNPPHSSRQHIVPVLLPQCPGLYISQLAILISGGAFCPINLDSPTERIKFVVSDVAADLIIATSEFKDVVSWEGGPKVIFVDLFPTVPSVQPSDASHPIAGPEDLAYVMYTSGSSGKPKGVAVSHLAVTQSLLAHQRHIPTFRRFLQFAAPSFDVSVFEIFFPLVRGCTLVGCNRNQLLNDLPGTINDLNVDAAELTPTVVGSLLQKRSNVPNLSLLLTIGEMLTWPIVQEFGGSETQSPLLYGMYGPTEAAIHCTIYPAMKVDTPPGNIGIPFDTVSTFIAAPANQDDTKINIKFLAIGELGELVLGGPQLAQGYLNREEQNRLAFIQANGTTYYRTGDKARQLHDGTIEILGRMSAGQVKLRGQRIELGEIEQAIYKHPGLRSVVALVINSTLVVFALVGSQSVDSADVRQTCAKWLPKFMVPNEIMLLHEFPYLPSGKVDKKALETDYQQQEIDEHEDSASSTPTQQIVQHVLETLLGPFPPSRRLAGIGLDSLVAIRVSSKLRELDFNITTVSVLQAETLAELAQACHESAQSTPPILTPGSDSDMETIEVMAVLNGNASDVESVMPCTPLQSAMLAETAADPKAYRNWVELELLEHPNFDTLSLAVNQLAEHNPILRTGFTESSTSEAFVQIVWSALGDEQVESVPELEYDLGSTKKVSLHHPIKFQVLSTTEKSTLLIHIHHALYDAWSLELLLDDLDCLLMGDLPRTHPPFSSIVQGYSNGTLKTDDWLSKQYWKDHLGALDPRPLPNFHSKNFESNGLAVHQYTSSISTTDVETAARHLNCSSQAIFQAAYAMVLSSYLGSSDVCFGTVFSGRTLPIHGIEDIVGPCLATLPIRVDTSLSLNFQDLIKEINSINRKHLEHSTVPLRDIKSSCGLQPRQHLFDTLMIWQQTLHTLDHARKCVTLVDTVDNLEFNLTLEVTPGKGNVVLKANYRQSIFPEFQIDLLLRQIEGLVKLAVGEQTVTPLENVFNHLGQQVLSIENLNPVTELKAETLSSPVERIASQDPTRVAIEFATDINPNKLTSTSITYFDLNTRANQMAHHLLSLNVLPDELVCNCMEKCIDLYISILSTAKIGAGYLPLTPDIPKERLQYILKESKARVVMTHSSLRPLFELFHDIEIVYVDEADFDNHSKKNISYESHPEYLSYCVFTSGSTGVPKAVLVTQGNLLSNLDALEELYPANENSRFLQSCSQAFDVSVFEIFFTWRIGGCICSAVKDVIFRDIEQAIRALDVTHLSLTPTVAALIEPNNVPKVEFLVTAGEAVTQRVFNTWADKGLYQGYGPSETTNICTVNPKVTHSDSINNIGRPFKNTSAFVLSRDGEFSLVPKGGEGEFCFGGSQVFRGYIDQSQQVGKIIDHPQFGRLYRSGDFGRLMPDGSLAFTGRKDDQVKIRGQRVELGEINNVMLRSKEVQDCVTMVIDSDGNSQLVCFWAPHVEPNATLTCLQPDQEVTSLLFKHLELALPIYMIPSALIPISHLPSTSQGKTDKRLLTKEYKSLDIEYLEKAAQAAKSSSDHEWTVLEHDIAQAVSQITKVAIDQIHPDTSFFALGIDSISAISLSRTLRTTTKRQVEISQILKNPSVVRLAEILLHGTSIAKSIETGDVDFGFDPKFLTATTEMFGEMGKPVQSIMPCTPLQEAMLSASESSLKSLYSNEVILDVHGDLSRLQSCWQEMVRRHEILRTCFVATDSPRYAYAQVVLKEHKLEFKTSNEGEINRGSSSPPQRSPFEDVKFEPPYSVSVFASANTTKLHISMHHALYDGVALTILYNEIERLYRAENLPAPVLFSPFLQAMSSMDMNAADRFWREALKGHLPKLFQHHFSPVKFQQPAQAPTQIQTLKSNFSLSWLEGCIKENSTSLLAVCHTAWSGLLSEQLQEKDVCFGSIVSGRTVSVEGIERLVAPCFNTIPTRLQDIHKLSYLEAFRKLQTLSVDSIPFQLTPLRRIQSKFSPNGSRLFDILFILQQPPRELDASIWTLSEDRGAMDFPVVIEVVPRQKDDILELILHSYTSVLSPTDAVSVLKSFEGRLEESLRNPRRQILSSEVKEQILTSSAAKVAATAKAKDTQQTSSHDMSPDEKVIQNVLADFTDVSKDKISRDVSIFRLGLDSISAVQVATRLRKLGHNVMASDILEHPSIAQLATHLGKSENKPLSEKVYDFELFDKTHRETIINNNDLCPSAIESIRPCTAVQRGMIAQSLHSQGEEYVNSMWMELDPMVSTSRLRDAWSKTCKLHEVLRTGFVSTDDPQNPFAMITYSNDAFQPPFYDGENGVQLLIKDIRRPWFLSIREEGGKNMMRLTAHHALYDGQSIQMILGDLARAYTFGSTDSRPPITSLLGAILSTAEENIEAQKVFWLLEENIIIINKFPELTPLQVFSTKSSVQYILSQRTITQLEDSCRNNGVTMQAACQVAWARLLAAYTGESSTTFGMALSGRSVHEEAERISFPSIVTLPVRCNITGTNADLLARTMTHNAKLHNHQFTSLTSIQKWAGYPEGKIFDTLFAYQKLPDSEDPNIMPWKLVREEAAADYAVSLEVQPMVSNELAIRLTFREDIIPVEHSNVLLRQYDALLLDTLEKPGNSCDVALSFGPELLSITPAKEDELPSKIVLLHQFVERGARQWPDKEAFEFATSLDLDNIKVQSWTYAQLEKEGNKIAQFLVHRGIQPGELIAISFDKCPEASFAIIGILKAGCAYVALDPNAPLDRVKFILEDSGARLVLTSGKPGQVLKDSIDEDIILLDSDEVWSGYSSEPPKLSREIIPQDVSYCLYTSGTTGTPKGCLITHENAVQAMLSFQRLFAGHWTEDSKWLQFASFHFDVSVLEQFWSWSVGICVSSAPRDLIFEDIPGTIQSLGITHIDLTPSLARLLHPDDVPSLCKGVFITGGEQLRQEILDVWGEHACIYNGYGPTEATIGVTMYPRVPRNGKPSNIGPAFDNVGSFVLKPGTEIPVLRGGVGELCVSGKLVGKGYLNRPNLTAERFPTLKEFGERVYRTGDLVRILHNGTFIFLGRADDQVKLRGQRLELTEINEVIKKAVEGLQDVVTLVLKHSTQQKEQLVTFFVSTYLSNLDARGDLIQKMKDACKARLPGYMIPTHFIPVENLPLNANNKADSKQLAKMYNDLSVEELQQLSHSDQKDEDWNRAEMKVVALIAKAMRVEDLSAITRGSNIFELGLDSISIIGFSRALQNFGLQNAKLSVVKNHPNIGALVKALSGDEGVGNERENDYVAAIQHIAAFEQKHMVSVCQELGVEAREVECVAPCTPVQEGMIYRFLESDVALYFNKFAFRIEEGVDLEELLGAWKCVVEKVQVLRTKFVATDDGFAQVVLRDVGVSWAEPPVDYSAMDKLDALRMPYTLGIEKDSGGVMMRVQIFHGLYDGISLTILLQKVVEVLNNSASVEYGPSFLSSLPYGPLSKIDGAQEFWVDHLKDWSHQPTPIILDSLTDVVASSTLTNLTGLEELRKSLGVTPQALIQASWLSVLQTITSPNITLGLVTSGRSIDFEDAENVIGPLFNTIPFHCDISSSETFKELIGRCHDINMRMQDFAHTPLKDIQKWSPAKVGGALFESLFVFQREAEGEETFADGVWKKEEDELEADYPLAFEATLGADGTLGLVVVARGEVITTDGATELLGEMEKTLRGIIASEGNMVIPGSKLSIADSNPTVGVTSRPTSNDVATQKSFGDSFEWTDNTKAIRLEISKLAQVPEHSIHHTSSIFELGLDSIDVIKLSSRLKKKGIEIPVSAIIKSQNIAKMALNISVKTNRSSELSSEKLLDDMSKALTKSLRDAGKLPDDTEAVLPTTPLQQSMVNELIRSDYERYLNIDALKLRNNVDFEKLMAAVEMAVESSPIFRARFVEVEDPNLSVSYAQIIPSAKQKRLARYKHTLSPDQKFFEFMRELDSKCVSYAKDRGELFQIHFIDSDTAQYFVMVAAHALYDGTSMRLLHEDIVKAYQGTLEPRLDFMPFLGEVVRSTTEEAKKFWRSTLSGLPSASLPKRQISGNEEFEIYRIERTSHVSFKNIESLCKSSRVTLQTVGQTAWALVLAHLMGQLDVVFGSVLSCRDTEEANEVMFPLMNTVAVRSVLHGTLGEMLSHMQNMSDTTRQYQYFPLGTAQAYALGSRRDHNSKDTTLFDTLFIYQGRRNTSQEEKLYDSVYGGGEVEFPICVEMEVVDDRIIWTTACKAIVKTEDETYAMLEALDSVLRHLIDDTKVPTIVSDSEGLSICGLPRFEMLKSQPKANTLKREIDREWTEVELKIRKALHEVSNIPEESIHKDSTIFHLGLDSILVLKLPAIFRKMDLRLSVSDVLREQTIHFMADSIARAKSEVEQNLDVEGVLETAIKEIGGEDELRKLRQEIGEIHYVMPVTAGQLYMIRRWQASKGGLFYPTFTYKISSRFNKEQLEKAWEILLSRHDILRTGFLEVNDKILQVIFKEAKNSIRYEFTPAAGYDLRTPPVSLSVSEIKEGTAILNFKIHHALYDGISLPILINDLQSLYLSKSLPPIHQDFCSFIAHSLAASQTAKQEWSQYLSSAPSLPRLPTFKNTNKRTEIYHPSLPIPNLSPQARHLGVTIDTLLLASIAKTYSQHLGTKDVLFGIYLANRAAFGQDLRDLVAPTLNFIPVFVRGARERGLGDLANGIQHDLGMFGDEGMGCVELEELGKGVGLWVNILKDSDMEVDQEVGGFEGVGGFEESSGVAEGTEDEMVKGLEGRECCEAYQVC